MKKNKILIEVVILILITIIALFVYFNYNNDTSNIEVSYEISDVPIYNGKTYVLINNNIPKFNTEDINKEVYYSDLIDERVRNGYDKDELEKSE